MIKSSFSQTVYPKKVILGRDTVVALTPKQVDAINKTYISLDECNTLNDSLNSQIDTYDQIVNEKNNQLSILHAQINSLDTINKETNGIVADDEKLIKIQKRKIGILKFERGALSIAVIVAAILILIHK